VGLHTHTHTHTHLPEKIQKCYDSWKKFLPEYRFELWDDERVHALNNKWCEEAIVCQKYAFAADYVRFYAVYNYGGIWLDTDVEVVKPLDSLCELQYFIGEENCGFRWGSGVFGAEKGVPWIKRCLDYYQNKAFINPFGEMRMQILPWVMQKSIESAYMVKKCETIEEWTEDTNVVCIFPEYWFTRLPMASEDNENSYTIHHFTASWQNTKRLIVPLTVSQRILGHFKRKLSYIKHQLLHL